MLVSACYLVLSIKISKFCERENVVAFVRCSPSEPNLHDYNADDKNMNRGSLTYDRLAGHQNLFCSPIQRLFINL